MSAQPLAGWRAGVAIVALVLLWRVVHVNGALYEAGGARALAAPAGDLTAPQPGAREVLRGLVHDNPAEVAAVLMLARDDEQAARFDEAARAYRLATRLAPLERDVLGAAAGFFLRQGEVREALPLLGRLVENYPEAREQAFPVLAEVLVSGRHAPAWRELAAGEPSWMRPFLLSSCARGIEPLALAPLLPRGAAGSKPAGAETDCVVGRLRAAGHWDEAYQIWLNTLPRARLADVGFVFNGGFEFPASAMGFDWLPSTAPARQAGHEVVLVPTAGAAGKRALRVSYNGRRQQGPAIRQYLAAPAGRYELSGLARPDSIKAGRGVHWTLRCVERGEAGRAIAASERFVGSSEWRRFTVDVTIEPRCAGQLLQLEAVGADAGAAFVEGTVWFDELVLRRRA